MDTSGITSSASKVFVGCDPGFTDPCVAIIHDDTEPTIYKPDVKLYKAYDDYSRSFCIGKKMAEFVQREWPRRQIVLGIEGPSYGSKQRSSSMEQMALCRQGIFDAFVVTCDDLVDWHQIAPTTAKKAITGNGRADKETVVAFARVLAPNVMKNHETFREVHKRNGTVEQQLEKTTSAMADALSIAVAAKEKWEK
jgi:Holliday junction resolvasome RuvABC endonuclease subunit